NSGTATLTGTGTLFLAGAGSIANAGLFDVTSDTTISASFNTMSNSGTFRKQSGLGTLQMTNLIFNNSGTLDVVSGIVDLASGTSTGVFQVASTTEVLINSDTYTLNNPASVTGFGKIKVAGGTLIANGTPNTVINYQQIGGTLDGTGTLQIGLNGDWSGGTMQGSGMTTVNGSLSISGAAGKTLDTRTFNIGGVGFVNVNGTGNITMQNGGNIVNGGTFVVNADNSFLNGGSAGGFANNFMFRKQTTTGATSFSNIAFSNTATIDLQTGILAVTGGFSQTTGTLKLTFGGVLAGTQFAQLQTSANPTLAGTLQVLFNGPYEPNPGDSFRAVQIATGTHSGTFTPNYPAMCCGKTWSEAYDANGILLSVNGTADLTISKNAPTNVTSGNPITYTLTVNNGGPDPATGVSVTDVLQTGHTGISANGGAAWNCNVVVLTVTCTATSNLATGNAPNITINANAPSTPQTFTNVANVSSSNDPNGGNNSGSAIVTVDPAQADISVGSTATPPGPVTTGVPIVFNFTITNNGPATATNVSFSASVPAGLTFTSSSPTSPTCTFASNTLTCANLGSLNSGNFTNVTINATTNANGTQTVTGSASATETDPFSFNNTNSASVVVSSGATLTVINTNDSGSGSLRQAILDANANVCTAPCTINFNIPGTAPFQIAPVTDLPILTANANINAMSQPGYAAAPLIEIDGTNTRFFGLQINANGAAVHGLSITGNTLEGIFLDGNNNTIESCWIGLNTAGAVEGNGQGIAINGASNIVGGTTAAQRNVISGNTGEGVHIFNNSSGNLIRGNYIGTNTAGTAAAFNAVGVKIADNADNNTIGGATTAEANVISGNGQGVVIICNPTTCDGNVIRKNRIGVDANTGTTAVANVVDGVELTGGATATTIRDNVIAGNNVGVDIANSDDTTLRGNLIGVGADGVTAVSNASFGVLADVSSTKTFIGGVLGGEGNTIAHNGADGVAVANSANGAVILGNSFFANANDGIDLGNDGPTANDSNDADSGANGKQNFPTLTDASLTPAGIHLAWNIDSSGTAAQSLLFEFYKTDGAGEGKTFVGRDCLAFNNLGAGTTYPTGGLVAGDTIVGTATSYSDTTCSTVLDGTSEFTTTPIVVTNCTPPNATITAPPGVCANSTGNNASVPVTAGASYSWGIVNGTITSSTATAAITFTAGATGAVTLNVTVTDSIGCVNTNNVNVPITPPPAVTITGPTTSCPGANVTLDAGAGFASYLWNTSATSQQITVNPTIDTTYTVTVSNGSCSNSDSHTVTMNAVPAPTITGPTATCSGTPVTLDAGAGFASYLWNTGATSQQITVSPTSTQTYTVTVTNASGCSGSDNHTVTVSSNPTATITAPPAVCANANGNASVAAQAGATYTWGVTNGTLNTGQGTPAITFTAGSTGSVVVNVTVTAGSCTSTGNATIPIVPPPSPTITGPTQVCPNTTFVLDAGAGFASYLWSTGATSQQITVSQNAASSTYSVQVTNAGGCSGIDSHVVTLLANPDASINAPGNVDANSSNTASVPSQGGATYNWSITNGSITAGQGTNAITFTAGGTGNVVLSVTVTIGSCTATGSTSVAIGSQQADMAIVKTATASVQGGGTITYTLNVTNNGPDSPGTVLVIDDFPFGATPRSASGSGWTCDIGASSVVCRGTSIPVGPAPPIVITATAPQQGGTITNTASVSASIADPNGANDSSSASTVVNGTQPQCPTTPAQLLSPSQGANVSSPVTFSWTPVSGADDYDVFTLGGIVGTTSGTSLTATMQSGPITWWVVARFGDRCDPLVSTRGQFTVGEGQGCASHGAPQTIQPSLNSTAGPTVQFMWTAVPGAIGYRLYISVGGEATQDIATTDGATFFTTTVQPGRISWFVRALFAGCPETQSNTSAFNVPEPDPCANRGIATLTSPAN
ncbi:MAG TPA: right-handed parallel beta-helix repeat-containing protein, partial [Thermoanaerobaculia bacterium]|nr:right-handed parallel beta-helix repeat-containing protein [Thermoanaerobaculia bacterium]